MKKYIAAALFLFISISLWAQENKTDDKGRRHGLWKGTYEETKRPRYEGTFSHGKETGIFRFFEDNAASTLMATRDFTAKDGSVYTIFYDEKGLKISEGKEVSKLREGVWKFYHPGSEKLMSVEHYSKGNLIGVRKVYFPNGAIAEETGYVNGLKDGVYKKYTEKGIVLEESHHKEGKFHGPAKFRDAEGNIASEGVYANGLKTGIWKFYQNGKIASEGAYSNGIKTGIWKFYKDGKLDKKEDMSLKNARKPKQ